LKDQFQPKGAISGEWLNTRLVD